MTHIFDKFLKEKLPAQYVQDLDKTDMQYRVLKICFTAGFDYGFDHANTIRDGSADKSAELNDKIIETLDRLHEKIDNWQKSSQP